MPDDVQIPTMIDEHNAWQEVAIKLLGVDLDSNKPELNPLVRTIQLWGEHLAALRIEQSQEDRAKARDYAEKALEQAKKP